MSKENKHALSGAEGLIPEMRFPEFANEAEWKLERLGNLANTTIGEFVIKTKQHPDSLYPVYNGGKSYTGFYDEYNNEENKIVISARGANAGFVNLVKQKYWAGNSCYSVGVLDPNRIDLDLLFYYVKHNQRRFTDNQQAANIPSVSKGDVEKFQICFPDNPQEQQKIASCLSSLDELIAAHKDKLDALKDHKKGLLQNLLNREIRFKKEDGREYTEWKEVKFTDCCDLIHGFQFRKEHFTTTGIPIIKIGSLVDNGCLTFQNATHVDPKYKDDFTKFELKKGDVLMALTGGTLGKVSRISKDYGLIFQNYRVGKFEPKKNATKDYIYFILQSTLVQNRVKSLVNEAAQPNFGKQDFDKIRFFLPSIEEQQKIASCLSAVDELIIAQQEKIEQLQQHKKGLMQGLFPKITN